jgi:cytochrome c-type biogenesis protein CcmH/NrfG
VSRRYRPDPVGFTARWGLYLTAAAVAGIVVLLAALGAAYLLLDLWDSTGAPNGPGR